MTLSESLYEKLVNNRISIKALYSNVSEAYSKRQVLAHLYLVNKGRGVLSYYPYNRGNYTIEIPDLYKFKFYISK